MAETKKDIKKQLTYMIKYKKDYLKNISKQEYYNRIEKLKNQKNNT